MKKLVTCFYGRNNIDFMSRFEVRCHEWGDDSDYHWEYCDTLEAALKVIKDFYQKNPDSIIYERLYVYELHDDGTRSVPEYNHNTFEPLDK